MNRLTRILALSAVVLTSACSQVELCDSTPEQHPHSAYVQFDFDWSRLTPDISIPDSMGVVTYRVVNQWKSMAKVNSQTLLGNFIKMTDPTDDELNALGAAQAPAKRDGADNAADDSATNETPTGDGSETDGGDSSTETPDEQPSAGGDAETPDGQPETPSAAAGEALPGEPMASDARELRIKPGDYKFYSFAYDPTAIEDAELRRFVNQPPTDANINDVCVTYRQFAMDDPQLNNKVLGWDDYNAYAAFVQPNLPPVLFDTTQVVSVARGEHASVTLRPQYISQNIDIYFNIRKDISTAPFVIDSVWAEISGVVRRINLTNGHLDIAGTSKTMFRMTLTDRDGHTDSDQAQNDQLECHANINVTGIVPPSESATGKNDQSKREYGPGLMQVIIFTHNDQTDPNLGNVVKHKRFQGKINLYNTLRRSPSVKLTEDMRYAVRNGDHCTIRINTDIVLDGKTIESSPSNDGGVEAWDKWTPTVEENDLIIEI